jgi:hypothetical protein
LFLVAAFYLPINQMTWSAVGTVAMNLVLIIWLKPGRKCGALKYQSSATTSMSHAEREDRERLRTDREVRGK